MSTSDWYQRKFSQPQPQQRVAPPVAPQPQQRAYQGYPTANPPIAPQQYAPPPARVTTENLWEMMQFWKGGKAHMVDAQPCPSCGGNQYYSRSQGAHRGPPPAPHCYNCGYNGLFEQGLPSTWNVQ